MSATVLSRPPQPVAYPPARRLLVAGLLGLLAVTLYVVFVAPARQLDLDVFLRAGQAVLHGHNPYSSLQSETIRTNAAFVYPIAVAWWFAPLSALGSAGPVIYAFASICAICLACWWACPRKPLIAAAVLLSSCAIIGLQDGSVNPWLLLGLVAAWRWRDRPVASGVVLAALIVCKLFLWPMLGWLLLTRRYRSTAVAAGLAGTVLAAGWIFGPLGSRGYASMLHVLSGLEAPHAAGLSGLLLGWHASLGAATAMATGIGVVLLATTGYQFRRRSARVVGDRPEVVVFGTAVIASLLASPIVWHHYYLLLAAPLLLATQSVWPFVALSLVSWAAAAPHAGTPGHTAAGYVLGLGGIVVVAAIAALQTMNHRTPGAAAPSLAHTSALSRVIMTGRPVAVVVGAMLLVALAISAVQKVPVGTAWGALVAVAEATGVLAYVWSRRSDSIQVDRGLVRSN